MAIVCQECRRTKSAGHKFSCTRGKYRANETWVDSFSNRVVTDVTGFIDTSSSCDTSSSDSGSSSSCD